MLSSWISNLLTKLDLNVKNRIEQSTIRHEYQRDIITGLDWTIRAVEECEEFGDDALILTVYDNVHDSFYDCVIPRQAYPAQIDECARMIDQQIVGANLVLAYDRNNGQPAIVTKYVRIILDGHRKANPHMTVDAYTHSTKFAQGRGRVESKSLPKHIILDTFPHVSAAKPKSRHRENNNARRPSSTFSDSSVINPTHDVYIAWNGLLDESDISDV